MDQPAEAVADLQQALELWAKAPALSIVTRLERSRALALLAGLGKDAKAGVTADEAKAFADQAVAALADAINAGWAVPCPCGTARRAFADTEDFPGTIHVTEISADSQLHYHKRLTETYYFLECQPAAKIQLNEEVICVQPGDCIMIRPGTRHRAIGQMKVLIVVYPKFDETDEWFD